MSVRTWCAIRWVLLLTIGVIGAGARNVDAATPTPTVLIALSPLTITSGASSTITWSSTDATSCAASGNWAWSGVVATSGTRVTSQSGSSTYHVTYTLTCSGAGGSASSQAVLIVQASGIPTVTLTATPGTISAGGSSTLNWSAKNATACSSSGGWTGARALSGSLAVSPANTTAYTLICTGASGSSQASTTVSVTPLPAPTVSVAATPSSITVGGSATLTWSSANATSCAASGAWSGTQAGSGATSVAPASAGVYTYTLTCTGAGGSGSASTSVTASAAGQSVATVNPLLLTFASQTTGTTSAAQTISLSNTGTGTLANIVISTTGDFIETNTCAAVLAAGANCTINVNFAPMAAGARAGTVLVASDSANGPLSVSLSGPGSSPGISSAMTLISRGVPIVASSALYHATSANDGDYSTEWRSNGAPATLALDLSSVPAAQRQNIWLVWYNDGSYAYDHALINQPGYNNAGSYTIEANAAPGGGAAPATGWVPLASLSGNVLHSYSHYLNFAGYNWIRGNFAVSDGSVLNADIALNLDVYSANNGVTDGWFFNGDSITANCMRHNRVLAQDQNNPGAQVTIATPSFGVQVNAIVGNNTPMQENGGIPGFTSGNMVAYLAGWVQHIPSRYVTINLGTNDAVNSGNAAAFYANMEHLVQAVLAAGKVPVVPTIPYSTDPKRMANIPALNDQIRALYLAYPIIVPGPDLWSYFMNNPQYISTDQVHPNAQGCVAYRTLWSQYAASTMYGH
ncbi:MAG TPA: GDSL-type esterase/lipase family protein [Steroidobacteraceae bacterium]|nr:GDSL-type esterase/lipase family protein [Steroidobacteraceae bacterium]